MAVPLTLSVFRGDQFLVSKEYDRDIIKIGRLSSAHLCLDDEKVSRIHSVIEVSADGSLSIIDMGSVEGTFVNGKRVNKGSLVFGDQIRLGNTVIKVEQTGGITAVIPALPPIPALDTVPTNVTASPVPRPVAAVATSQVQAPYTPVPSPSAGVALRAPVAPSPAAMRSPMVPPPPPVDEDTGVVVRARPPRRQGSGPLGVELRFLWGDQMVGEYFVHPDSERRFTIGSAKGVDFEMGDGRLGGPKFELLRSGKAGVSVRFTGKMHGELQRRLGEETMTLQDAKQRGIASDDGDGTGITLGHEDFAWIDLGGIVVEVFFQPAPRPVFVPLTESIDFTVMNIFLVCFFLAALFIISAANHDAEGEAFDDELNSNQSRIAKLLIKPPEKNPILEKFGKAAGEIAQKHKGTEGEMGKKDAPKRSAHAAPKGDPSNKDQARLLMAKVFGGNSAGGISTVFGHQGLGGELKSAMGNMFGAAPGDAAGLGGLGLRGSGSGGGGVGDSIGIGGINTRGRGGGTEGYGSGVGALGGKKGVDIGITSSDPMVVGSLDKELIRKVIHANRNQIRFCYESQLNRFPKLEGKVSVRFMITAEGSVSQSSVAQSTVGNAELEACVAGRVRMWTFPKPKGGGIVIVTYPFIFKQSGQ